MPWLTSKIKAIEVRRKRCRESCSAFLLERGQQNDERHRRPEQEQHRARDHARRKQRQACGDIRRNVRGLIDKVRISRKLLQIASSAARSHIRQRKENGGNDHQRKIQQDDQHTEQHHRRQPPASGHAQRRILLIRKAELYSFSSPRITWAEHGAQESKSHQCVDDSFLPNNFSFSSGELV